MLSLAVSGVALFPKLADLLCQVHHFFILLMLLERAWVILDALSILAPLFRIECLAHVTLPLFALSLVRLILVRLWCDKLSDWVVAIAMLVGASVSLGTVAVRFQIRALFMNTNHVFCCGMRFLRWGVVVVGTRFTFLAITLTK
jgi:hypothetical protein